MTTAGLKRRIAYWQDQMGLGGWVLSYSPLDADSDSLATTNPDFVNRQAVIRLSKDCPEDQVDRLIVHELGHCLTGEMHDLFDRAIAQLSNDARHVFEEQWHRSQEWVLERLADTLTGIARREFNDDAPAHWKHSTQVR